MKIAILGFAGQGQSSFEYWNRDGNEITICDLDGNITVPEGAGVQLGKDYLIGLDRFDVLVRTPILHPRDIVAANPETPNILDKVTSNTNEFFSVCPTKNIIGVTGTKGKGTTSTLIAQMLEAAGFRVHLGGNIGIPPLELLKSDIKKDDWVVLELANSQLIDLKYSPHIGVCLMVEPEHMDWHEDFEEYIAAKQQLFMNQESDDIAIYYAHNENSGSVADASLGKQITYMEAPGAYIDFESFVISGQEVCKVSDIKLLGKHNWQNVCAAITAVWQVTKDTQAMQKVLSTFTGLEHRLEFVRELDGVKYFDDSFGTTPETATVAIQAFTEPKVVILGGSDKGSDYGTLANTVVDNKIRKVLLIGEMGPTRIKEALDKVGFRDYEVAGNTMNEIVTAARAAAQPGDIVLLSTGCASFGLFKNYKDRGEQFIKAVQALA